MKMVINGVEFWGKRSIVIEDDATTQQLSAFHDGEIVEFRDIDTGSMMTMTREEFKNLRKGLIEIDTHYEGDGFTIDNYAEDGAFSIERSGFTYYYSDIVAAIMMFNLMDATLKSFVLWAKQAQKKKGE